MKAYRIECPEAFGLFHPNSYFKWAWDELVEDVNERFSNMNTLVDWFPESDYEDLKCAFKSKEDFVEFIPEECLLEILERADMQIVELKGMFIEVEDQLFFRDEDVRRRVISVEEVFELSDPTLKQTQENTFTKKITKTKYIRKPKHKNKSIFNV